MSPLAAKLSARAGVAPSLPGLAQIEKEAVDFEERLEDELPTNIEEAREWIFANADSYQKMRAVVFLLGQVALKDWLRLLGDVCTCCDNLGMYRDDLVEIFRDWLVEPETVIPELMTDEEEAALAAKFPFMARYRTEQPHTPEGHDQQAQSSRFEAGKG